MTQATAIANVRRWAAHEARVGSPCLALLHEARFERGVSMLALPVARKGYAACYVHLGRVTKPAAWWHARLRVAGHFVAVCATWPEAVAALALYVQRERVEVAA